MVATFIFWVVVDGDNTGPYASEKEAREAARAIQKVDPGAAIQVVRERDYRLGLNRGGLR